MKTRKDVKTNKINDAVNCVTKIPSVPSHRNHLGLSNDHNQRGFKLFGVEDTHTKDTSLNDTITNSVERPSSTDGQYNSFCGVLGQHRQYNSNPCSGFDLQAHDPSFKNAKNNSEGKQMAQSLFPFKYYMTSLDLPVYPDQRCSRSSDVVNLYSEEE